MKLSVYIITLNEEKRLERTLKAVCQVADEIIVVDSGSRDKTEEIAKKYNCKFMYNKWISYCEQKHFAQEQCSNDYVLMVDADEVLSSKLIDEINEIKKDFKYNAYSVDITDMILNETKPRFLASGIKNVVRLYNKNIADLPKNLMNKDRVKVPQNETIYHLKNPMYHYSFLSITDTVAKYNLHSSELLNTIIKENKHYSLLRLITEFPRQFFKYYFIKRFFVYGTYGFMQAMVCAYFRFLKVAKYFEYKMINNKQNNTNE